MTSSPEESDIDEIVARCIEAIESGTSIETILSQQPAIESAVRSRLDNLLSAGILHPPEEIPDRIGPYRVLDQIGRGGMGSVFLAEQREPIQRRVAIKVIKLGMDTREVLVRFEAERQAMALMEHPGIAKVFDAGSTEAGRPYVVMEHIDGERITRYADEHNLTTEQRLELMIPLCEAVQHAHQKGVIHRDLKPSNVLVRNVEGRALPTVIDFGIAKAAIGQPLTDHTAFTDSGTVLGTPEYMSPEQARRDEVRVDTRTDVYSLGVVLYELLTGVLPFDPEHLRSAGFGEMLRILNEDEPQSPSTRVSTLNDGTKGSEAIVRARRTDPGALRKRLRGDLDWIARKALEKDPARRYATPAQMAMDIRRHLEHEPISAGPVGLSYRLKKLVRRHRIAVAAASAVLLAMAVGLVVSLLFWADARRAQKESDIARSRAQSDYDRALEAVDAMIAAVGDKRLTRAPGLDSLRRDLLQKAANLYQGFLSEHQSDAALLERNAFTHGTLARLHDLLGELDQSQAQATKSQELFEALLRHPKTPPESRDRIRSEIAQAMIRTGGIHAQRGEADKAEAIYLKALDALKDCSEAERATTLHISRTASAHNLLGQLLARSKPEAAEAALRTARQKMSAVPDEQRSLTLRQNLSTTLSNLGLFLMTASRWEESEPVFLEAKELLDRLIAEDPDSPQLRSSLAAVHSNIAFMHTRTRRSSIAHQSLEQAIAILRKLSEEQPLIVEHREQLAGALNNLASARMKMWKTDEARVHLLDAVEVYDGLVARAPEVPAYTTGLSRALSNIARTHLIARGKPENRDKPLDPEAATVAERAEALLLARVDKAPEDFECYALAAQIAMQRGSIELELDRPTRALDALKRGVSMCNKLVSRFPSNRSYVGGLVQALHSKANIHMELKEWQQAIDALDDAIDTQDSVSTVESTAFDQVNVERMKAKRAKAVEQLERGG